MEILVSTEWLANELSATDLKVVDASYFALDPARNAAAEYEAEHIPGAVFMDLGNLNDTTSSLPGMLPPPEKFIHQMQAIGLDDISRIVLYDNTPHRTAARAWWMLRTFGVSGVAVLDGGLAKWKADGRPLVSGMEELRCGHFTVRQDHGAIRSLAQMKANLVSEAEQVLDARGTARFNGKEADPRGLAPGHIPGSKNLPHGKVLNADGTFKRGEALRLEFEAAGIDLDKPLVTTCGSGVTAAVLLFAAKLLGNKNVALYDGSWSEWGMLPDTPKAAGPDCEPPRSAG